MPPKTRKQQRFMNACRKASPSKAKKMGCPSKKVAREFSGKVRKRR